MGRNPKVDVETQMFRQAACRGCVLRGWKQISWFFGTTMDVRLCKKILGHYRIPVMEPGMAHPMLSVDAFVKIVTDRQLLAARVTKASDAATMAQKLRTTRVQKAAAQAARTDLPKIPE